MKWGTAGVASVSISTYTSMFDDFDMKCFKYVNILNCVLRIRENLKYFENVCFLLHFVLFS